MKKMNKGFLKKIIIVAIVVNIQYSKIFKPDYKVKNYLLIYYSLINLYVKLESCIIILNITINFDLMLGEGFIILQEGFYFILCHIFLIYFQLNFLFNFYIRIEEVCSKHSIIKVFC